MIFEFGDFELSDSLFELRRFGRPVRVQPKVLELIVHLAKNAHRVVTTKELFRTLWPDQAVGETSLTKAVRGARLALGDSVASQAIVRTVRRQGYRFAAPLGKRPATEFAHRAIRATPSSACKTALTLAAVIGHEFSLELLCASSRMSPRDLTMLLEEAVGCGLVARVPNATSLYMFTRAVIRTALWEGLSGRKLSALGRRVAHALDARARASRGTNGSGARAAASAAQRRPQDDQDDRAGLEMVRQWSGSVATVSVSQRTATQLPYRRKTPDF